MGWGGGGGGKLRKLTRRNGTRGLCSCSRRFRSASCLWVVSYRAKPMVCAGVAGTFFHFDDGDIRQFDLV